MYQFIICYSFLALFVFSFKTFSFKILYQLESKYMEYECISRNSLTADFPAKLLKGILEVIDLPIYFFQYLRSYDPVVTLN